MKKLNNYELLLNIPDSQVTRCRLVFQAVSLGQWDVAARSMRNAADAEGKTAWGAQARLFADACQRNVNPFQIVAEKHYEQGGG